MRQQVALLAVWKVSPPFLNLFEREREREHELVGGVEGEGEADSPLSREPEVGLYPRTLGL